MNEHPPDRPSQQDAEAAVRVLLQWIGEDPNREGLIDTPKRVARAYSELLSGYCTSPKEVLDRAFEDVADYDELVVIQDIPFHSLSEHDLLPVIGKAHVGYLPKGKVVGLSKIASVVDIFAHRLLTQAAMTVQIAAAIQDTLDPQGVAVVVEAEHLGTAIHGIAKRSVRLETAAFTGIFRDHPGEQTRFQAMLHRR